MRLAWALFAMLAVLPREAVAHPGRLDAQGCHHVTHDWRYADGRVLKKGTRHCHRNLGAMKLDGTEMIEDPDDRGWPDIRSSPLPSPPSPRTP